MAEDPIPQLDAPAPGGQQTELPFASVRGESIMRLPNDLHIPPDALEVFLESFEGPLDLLLYLIRRQNIDILDIPMLEITRQYLSYIELMEELHLELAGEYLLMAAVLAEIKSRMLLPQPQGCSEEEEDPRANLVRRLQEYGRFKEAATRLDSIPRYERDILPANADLPEREQQVRLPEVALHAILDAFAAALARAGKRPQSHSVLGEPLSVRERMASILDRIEKGRVVDFLELFELGEGRAGVIVSLLAILELVRESLLQLEQEGESLCILAAA